MTDCSDDDDVAVVTVRRRRRNIDNDVSSYPNRTPLGRDIDPFPFLCFFFGGRVAVVI